MSHHPEPGITVHLAERLDAAAEALCLLLDGPRADPFAADLVCVPGPGVQRWLAQRVSEHLGAAEGQADGICAGITFADLTAVCEESLVRAGGQDPRTDPWSGEQLSWAILRAFEACADQDWFEPVAVHLAEGDDARPGRRYATARRLARLFRRWLAWQPDALEAWLTSGDQWQARLWRAVASEIGRSPFDERRAALAVLADNPAVLELPPVVHAVVPGRVPPGVHDVVRALSVGRDVHVWLVVPDASAVASGTGGGLLASSLSRSRTYEAATWARTAARVIVHTVPEAHSTILGRVQHEVRGRPVTASAAPAVDRSLQVHSSHGPERQVEVLRDVLVDLLEQDPTLEPRHILVATPDLDTYGPLVRARCGLDLDDPTGLHPAHRIRVLVADRSLRNSNPVLDVLVRMLDLVTSRAEVSELLDLCGTAPVARRFGFTGSEERLATLMRGSGMRWGIDTKTRRRFGVATVQNTWQAGLNRLLLGVTMSERELTSLGVTLPYDLIESQDIPLLGGLAELAGRVRQAADVFATPATPAEWAERFRTELFGHADASGQTVGGLISVAAADSWQVAHAQGQLTAMAEAAGPDGPPLALGDIKALVRARLQGRHARSALLTGNLTVTSLDALPHVPHRVVVLLGLDEQSFPRAVIGDGDDVLGRAEGEGDPALDDRQSFLDALMSATQTFVAIQRGRDTRTNDEVPWPIPVRELLAAVARTSPGADVVVTHRLQPYDLEGFIDGAAATYDGAAAADAAALLQGRALDAPRLRDRHDTSGVPPYEKPDLVMLDELIAFLRDPLGHFRSVRLGLSKGWSDDQSDQIPLELGGLEGWSVKDRLLTLRLAGHSQEAAEMSERLRGTIPPGGLGTRTLSALSGAVEDLVRRAGPILARRTDDVELSEFLDRPGVRLSGRVATYGSAVAVLVTGFPKGKHFVELWVKLLAAAAVSRDVTHGLLVTDRSAVTLWAPDDPQQRLAHLAEVYLAGLSTVLILPPDTAWATARARLTPSGDDKDARRQWRYEHSGWKGYVSSNYDDLVTARSGPGAPMFSTLVDEVYGPMAAALKKKRPS